MANRSSLATGLSRCRAAQRRSDLRWTMKPDAPRISYEQAVAAYKAEYARRYNELMHGAPAK